MKAFLFLLVSAGSVWAQMPNLEALNHNKPVLDAHNCYPYDGQWTDRIDRALKSGFPVSIEQDLAMAIDPVTGKVKPVVTHTTKLTGTEPALRDYFFEHVRPIVEKALADNDRSRWPLIVLHFDFKSLEPALLRAVWDELGEYESWISTAAQTNDPGQIAPLDVKPILVITEDADVQEQVFSKEIPKGARLRVFGSAHNAPVTPAGASAAERAHIAATVAPDKVLTDRATNYRRWSNNSWAAVEEGGQAKAGDWTSADAARLKALVDHAHRMGYWIRFYTLDGFATADSLGWDASYNFGTKEAAAHRWRAAIDAGVNFIATDQYEDLAAMMKK